MAKFIFQILLIASFSETFAQSTNNRTGALFFIDYTYQKTNNLSIAVGPVKFFQRHSYLGLLPGLTYIKTVHSSYLRPTAFIEYFYQPSILKGAIGPLFRLGIIPVKFLGLRDTYLTCDVGFRLYLVTTIYAGYNYSIDKKDLNEVSNFRIGIRSL